MSIVSLLNLAVKFCFYLAKWVTQKELINAEERGEEIGEARQFLLWKQELDRRAEEAAIVGDDVVSGRVRVDPETDPFNRARRK